MVSGIAKPVTFTNGSRLEIHGKMFERPFGNLTYLDDIGIPNATLNISFDGQLISGGVIEKTGNSTTRIDPFGMYGNGTFKFILDIDKPAGEYELHARSHIPGYNDLHHRVVLNVNHPLTIDMGVSPASQVVGQGINITGSLSDDLYNPVHDVPLQVWFDDVLLGPSSDGVYIDDVEVQGTGFKADFEEEGIGDWTTYSAPRCRVGDQWEHGSPGTGHGPRAPHSGSQLWGTVLDGNYQRGAWSFLVTPRLNFTADMGYTLSFWAWWSVYWNKDCAYVLASVDGGLTWDEAGAMRFTDSMLVTGDWTLLEYNVTECTGSDDVKFAFVFYSVDKTLDVRPDATWEFRYTIPYSTEAGVHMVKAVYTGDLLFRESFQAMEISIKRITHFEFDPDLFTKVAYRNGQVNLTARLVDNMGVALSTYISGTPNSYQVAIYWNKTWRIDDMDREPVGPPSTMDPETGRVSFLYTVAQNQTLGPASVTFRFGGADFYTNASESDVYFVKAKVHVRLPEPALLIGHRDKILCVQGELRVVPDQSLTDRTIGDAIPGEFVQIILGLDRFGGRRTAPNGSFSYDYDVPGLQPLGDLPARFEFMGNSIYDPVTVYFNYTIVLATRITTGGSTVYKGTWAWINGTILDEDDRPIGGAYLFLIWNGETEIGRGAARADGRFDLDHFIEFEDKVGNTTVIVRFKGSGIYGASEAIATFIVKVGTILQRRDRVMSVVRGEQAQFSGKLFEDWGGTKGIEVQREEMSLVIDAILVNIKLTGFDGTVTFTVPIDPKLYSYGEVPFVLGFSGTQFFDWSRNVSKLVIKANSIISFTEVRVDGEIFDSLTETVKKGEKVYGRVLVQDDNFQPFANGKISVYYKEEGLRARKRLIKTGETDESGYFDFNWTPLINTWGNVTLIAEVDDQSILPSTAEYNITYAVPPPFDTPDLVVVLGDPNLMVGDSLHIAVVPRDMRGWDERRLNITLVSAPGGMEISPNGSITWTPGDGQVGSYTIRVWLFDGDRSETASFKVTVTRDLPGEVRDSAVLLGAIAILVIAILILTYTRNRRKRPEPLRPI